MTATALKARATQVKIELGIYGKRTKASANWALKAIDDLRRRDLGWFNIATIAQGILRADATGRTDGSMSLALRKMKPADVIDLVVKAESDGVTTENEVSAWLWSNRSLLVK